MSLLNFEKKYWESLENQQKQLVSLYEEIKSNSALPNFFYTENVSRHTRL